MAVDMSMQILIVDDYKTMLRIVRNLLNQLGFNNVDEATDGSTALQKLRERNFGLVISDWNMEPMTGLQLLKEVLGADIKLEDDALHHGHGREQDRERGRRQGSRKCNNYIVKPFNAATLKQKIASVIGDFDDVRHVEWQAPRPQADAGWSGNACSRRPEDRPRGDRGGCPERRRHVARRHDGDGAQPLRRAGRAVAVHPPRQTGDRGAAPRRNPGQASALRHG